MIGSTNSTWEVGADVDYEQLVNYTMIYDAGNECTSITGGWTGYVSFKPYGGAAGMLAKNSTNITPGSMVLQGGDWRSLVTKNTINLSSYVAIGMCASSTANDVTGIRFIMTTSSTTINNSTTKAEIQKSGSFSKCVSVADIVDTNTKCYGSINMMCSSGTSSGTPYAHKLFLTKADDWQTLVSKARITATSIDDVLTNSTKLLSKKNAVQFMIKQCTGDFMAKAITSSDFKAALNNSPHKDLVTANEHWSKFLNMLA